MNTLTDTKKSKPLNIIVHPHATGQKCWIAKELMTKLGIDHRKTEILRLGQSETQSTFLISVSLSPGQMVISKDVAMKLKLPDSIKLHCQRNADGAIQLGPVIGLLASSLLPYHRQFIRAGAKQGALFFVFRPQDVDWKQQTIFSFAIDQDGQKTQWKRQSFPLPDVVYDRIPNRKEEHKALTQLCVKKLREHTRIQMFNQGFYDKWTTYKRLLQFPEVRQWLPKTRIAQPNMIRKMLERYTDIYLKPIHGSLGLGIIRVKMLEQGKVECYLHHQSTLHRYQFHSIQEMMTRLMGHQLQRYLVQPTISLVQINQCPVDFRIHLHRDQWNQWKVVAIGAKMASKDGVTTHVRTGGSFLPVETVLRQWQPVEGEETLAKLQQSSIAISRAIAESETGPIGELGLDMGLDKQGKIWLFEVNAKPGRHIFRESWLRQAGKASVYDIIHYAFYLSQFTSEHEGERIT